MDFRLLGPLEARNGTTAVPLGGRKQRALLARLLVDANRTVAVDRLVDDLWGEEVPESAVKMIHIYVSQLRKVLPPGTLHTRPPGYAIDVEPDALDLMRFTRLRSEAQAALAAGDPARASVRLHEALGLWRGPALAEFSEPFAAAEAAHLAELHLVSVEDRIDAELALGRHAELAAELESLVGRFPLRERLLGQLMLALYRTGRHAEALAAYQQYRRTLVEELGIEPSPRLRELEAKVLRHDSTLDHVVHPAPSRAAASPVPTVVPRGGPAPTGREPELDRLRAALADAVAGRRRVVFVTGDAGIGKTTLVEALLETVEDATGPLVARGHCFEHHGPGEPYLPVFEVVAGLAARPGAVELARLLAERAPTWLAHLPWLAEQRRPDGLGAPTVGSTSERMLREIVQFLESAAARRPLVLLFEDLHWGDYSTVDLISALARRRDPAALLVLVTYRPADMGGRRHPLRRVAHELCVRGSAEQIALGPLSEDALPDYLVERLGRPAPAGLAGLLHRRTAGNPLFIERTVDAWIADGLLEEQEATFDPAALAERIPETLRDLVEQQLSALGREEQRLLEAASVAGSEFAAAAVGAGCGIPDEEVEDRLEDLARHPTFIRPAGEESWPDGAVSSRYAFVHDLCQELLYARIAPGRRARLHQRIGARIEAAYASRPKVVAVQLATHFVRGRDAEPAVRHLALAAEQALERAAPREAVEHARLGLGLLDDLPAGEGRDRYELALNGVLGPALIGVHGWDDLDAERALVRMRALCEQLGDAEALQWALFKLATLYEVRAEYRRSERLLEESLALATRPATPGILVDSHELMACTLFHQGVFERALAHADEGLGFYDGLYANALTATFGDNPGVACHSWAALSLWFLGRPDAARERARTAVALADDPRRAHGRATALAQAAVVNQLRREPDEARRWAEAAIDSAAERGFAYRAAMGEMLRGWAVAVTGDASAGVDSIRRGFERSRATGVRMDDAYFLSLLADACRCGGLIEDGLEAVERALEAVRGPDRTYFYEPELHRLQGELLLAAGRLDEADRALQQALDVARRQRTPALELRAALGVARLWRQAGREAEARELVARPYGRFTEGFDTHDLVEAAAFLAAAGDSARPA